MWRDTPTHEGYPLIVRPRETIVSSTAVAIQSLIVVYAVRYQGRFEGTIGCPLLCLCLKNGRLNPLIRLVFVCINNGIRLALKDLLTPLIIEGSLRSWRGNLVRQLIYPFIIVGW